MPTIIKGVRSPRGHEDELAEMTTYMVEQIAKKFRNQAILGLQQKTVNKFVDTQVGNYASVFTGLAKDVSRKSVKQFDNKRIKAFVGKTLEKVNKRSQSTFYGRAEQAVGIPQKKLIQKEGLKPTTNALITETSVWVQKLRDETIQYFTANTLRAMTLGQSVDTILSDFDNMVETRKNQAKFVAQNQIQNFNSLTTNIRAKNIGVTKAVWRTTGDEKVRPSHADRDGKSFDISEGCYSSVDGMYLQAGTDFNCFPSDSKLNHTTFANILYRRKFAGNLLSFSFSDGVILRTTLNHPILTVNGFKPACLINGLDNIIRAVDDTIDIIKLYGYDVIPSFEQIFSSLDFLGVKHSVSAPIRGKFHSDTSDSEIDIIDMDSLLLNKLNIIVREKFSKLKLSSSENRIVLKFFTCQGEGFFFSNTFDSSPASIVSLLDLVFSSFVIHLSPLELFAFTLGSWDKSVFSYNSPNDTPSAFEMSCDTVFAYSVLVHGDDVIRRKIELARTNLIFRQSNPSLFNFRQKRHVIDTEFFARINSGEFFVNYKIDTIIDKSVVDFDGHIYNLQTFTGDYITNTTAVSNCRCYVDYVLEDDISEEE